MYQNPKEKYKSFDCKFDCNGHEIRRDTIDRTSSKSLIYSGFVSLRLAQKYNGIQEVSGSIPLLSTTKVPQKDLQNAGPFLFA